MRFAPRGLRARSALGFAVLGLALSAVLSASTYQLARWYLLGQREALAVKQSTLHAQVVEGQLAELTDPTADEFLGLLSLTKSRAVISVGSAWYAAVVDLDQSRVPPGLIDLVRADTTVTQRVRISDIPYMVVGVPINGGTVAYIEFVAAVEYERTLRTLGVVLMAVGTVTTLLGAGVGWALSRRVLKPLESVTSSAQAMSDGDLDQRLDVGDDPDLRPVAEAFNGMAVSLKERIYREQRFTADVSHELRTPLTAMSSAVGLAKRSSSPERVSFAMDVIADQVDQLRQLTVELLELAEVDARRPSSGRTMVDVSPIIAGQAAAQGVAAAVDPLCTGSVEVEVNPLRFERVVANLLENAGRYGGGATRVAWGCDGTRLRLEVDDKGPGVPESERRAIFGRFHRGSSAVRAGSPKGTGLGLSLVEEYVRLEGGLVWVEDGPSGGARFVVEIPGALR